MKDALKWIWTLTFRRGVATLSELGERLGEPLDEKAISRLVDEGLVTASDDRLVLTEKGRRMIKVVVCGGVFDILHPGHAFMLSQARALGDVLVVVVARDSTVEQRKRIPIVPERQRREMVEQLKPVDIAVLGREDDLLGVIEEISPDIIALGPDQHHSEEELKKELESRGLTVEVVRIKEYRECELSSTRAILQRIIERNYPDAREG